jgi:cell wall-associated NlpC family hydrolase
VRGLSTTARLSMAAVVVIMLCGGALITVPLLMLMTAGGAGTDASSASAEALCLPEVTVAGRAVSLDGDQVTNARTVVRTGQQLGVPAQGLVVAVVTALQESSLDNIGFGDRDSVGLFQQRNAWGSHAERTDVEAAARLFFQGGRAGQPGLLDIEGWQRMSVAQAAQSVQRSAFPLAYAKWEPTARKLVASTLDASALGCGDALATGLPGGATGSMLRVALQQQGDPYVWGAVGPSAFDCSGLVVYAWRQAGYRLKIRTAAQMYSMSDPVPRSQARPGDLLFGDFGHRGPGPGHVMIVIGGGKAVQAPAAGRNVEITDYRSFGPSWVTGRLQASAMVPIAS